MKSVFLLLLVVVGTASTLHLQETAPAKGEIFYRPGDRLRFTCDEQQNSENITFRWYINGLPIKGHHLLGWHIKSVDVHQNDIVLESQPSSRPSSTLYCKTKTKHARNVKRVFNLVKDIDRRPGGPVLRHADTMQKCPLYREKVLTLTCENSVKYVNITRWQWKRNGNIYKRRHNSPVLQVDRPGTYTCSYYEHSHHTKDALTFKVRRSTSGSSSISFIADWAFCKYTNRHPSNN